jgi:hypothetical protein
MTDNPRNHISIPSSKRDPKPRTDGSWWLQCKTHEELGAKARELFPNATCNETFSGVTLQIAADNKVL